MAATHEVVPRGKIASVITSLEMFARPAPRPAPDEPAWSLQRIEHPGLQWYRTLFRRIGERYLWYSRLKIDDAALQSILEDRRVEIFAFADNGSDAGLVELDFREERTCELAFFGLAPECVGIGAGRWLMNRTIDLAWSHPIRRLWVHTCTLDHPGAISFYLRSGFVAFERQIEVVDDPRVAGLLPRSCAPQIPLLD